MKKYKYSIFTIILFLICISNTYAACTQEEINEFKKIEDQYKITYEFNKSTKDYILYLSYIDINKYIYMLNMTGDIKCNKIETGIKCTNVKPGKYEVHVLGATNTCDDIMKKIPLNLPEFNKYSEDPLCDGIEEFVLCQPTYDKKIDYDTFASRIETYKKTKQKEETNKPNTIEKKDTKVDILVKYIQENLMTIIIVLIFIILTAITIIVTAKSIRKRRRLE